MMRAPSAKKPRPMNSPSPQASLPAVGIFSGLDAATRQALAGELKTHSLKRGDVLVRQGDLLL